MNNKKATLEFLTTPERIIAVIGSCPTNNNTHVATVYYYVDSTFTFFFLTASNSQKYRNLVESSNAAIATGFGPSETTVQAQGSVMPLDKDSTAERTAIACIKKRLRTYNDEAWLVFQLDTYNSEAIAVFKFTPDTLHLMNLKQGNGLPTANAETLQIL